MADLSITSNQVLNSGNGATTILNAAVAITAGATVYRNAATNPNKWSLGNGAAAATATITGIALNDAGIGQPCQVQTGGQITLGAGAAMAIGTIYVQSVNNGKIAPAADLATNTVVTILGVASTAAILNLIMNNTGVVHA